MLKCEGVMNFDLVGQNLTMSGLIIIAIIGKKKLERGLVARFYNPRAPAILGVTSLYQRNPPLDH